MSTTVEASPNDLRFLPRNTLRLLAPRTPARGVVPRVLQGNGWKKMAKKNGNSETAIAPAEGGTTLAKVNQVVDKWDDETQAEIDGWYRPEDNVDVRVAGRIEDYTTFMNEDGEEREVIVLRLATECTAMLAQEPIALGPNHFLAVGKRYHLGKLFELERGSCVAFTAKEKIRLRGGKTMWKFELKIDPKSRRPRTQLSKPSAMSERQLPAASAKEELEELDDLPF